MKRSMMFLAVAVLAALPSLAASTAFKGATIHPVSGPAIENGVMLLDGDKIVAVGADVAIPAGAEIIDITGKHLYPGFVSANSVLGLTEIGAVRSTRDFSEMGEINSDACPHQRPVYRQVEETIDTPTMINSLISRVTAMRRHRGSGRGGMHAS